MDDNGDAPHELTRPLPEDVARQLSSLAHLIDERIAVRGADSGVQRLVTSYLGGGQTRVISHDLGGLTGQLVTLALAGDIVRAAELSGSEGNEPPSYETFELSGERVRVPRALAAAFLPGAVAPCPLVVVLGEDWRGDATVAIHSRTEDVDADRHRGEPGQPLVDFLLALDGATSNHQGVATVATTNDVVAIDAAAKRAARLDRIIHVPPPDTVGRAAILRRYLRHLATDVDPEAVAAATDGATGADLREVVTLAVLHAATLPLTTDLLIRLARGAGYRPAAGQYL